MNTRQRFFRNSYPQVFFVLACGILLSLLFFWFTLPKITQIGLWHKGNIIAQNRAKLLGFNVNFQPSTPVWDFFGILPAAALNEKNCTYTEQYLSGHPELWVTSNNISTSRFSFSKNDLLSIFQTQTQDIPLLLQQQFLAAAVNIVNGADPGVVEASMRDASQWIDAHPPRIDLPEADSQTGLQLIRQLQNYNDGNTGPGLCPGQSEHLADFAPTSLPTAKPVVTLPQATESVTSAATVPQTTASLTTANQQRSVGKNLGTARSGSGGQSAETATSGSITVNPPSQVNEAPQPPAEPAASNLLPPTQVQQAPVIALNPAPNPAPIQDKEHRHSNRQPSAVGTPAPEPPQAQSDPQQSADTPAAQRPDGSGNNQGNGNGNSGGGQGNGNGNGHGNGNSGGHGNGNNGNHGGGGHGKGH